MQLKFRQQELMLLFDVASSKVLKTLEDALVNLSFGYS